MAARRLMIALSIALTVASVSSYVLARRFPAHSAPAGAQWRYAAATQPMAAGDVVQAVNLRMIDWHGDTPLTGAFSRPEDLVGRMLISPAAPGEPLLSHQFAAAGAGVGLSARIPDGMRAISLKSDAVVGVDGFMLPGTHVDVLVTYRPDNTQDSVTWTVLQDAQILAAGQKTQPDPEGKPVTVDVVTLLVAPKDGERVVLASAQGTVHFVLRNGLDHEHVDDQPTRFMGVAAAPVAHSLMRVAETKPAASPAEPKPYQIHITSGDKQMVETFK